MQSKTLYFDCPAGLSGDMILAALLDLGAGLDRVLEGLAGLDLTGYRVETGPRRSMSIQGLGLSVHVDPGQSSRDYGDIRRMIETAILPDTARVRALDAFRRLAEAESRVHGVSVDHVHFHEVGAVDSIVDVVGSMLALDLLDVEPVVCAPLPMGSGIIPSSHGALPLPAPATLHILEGVPVYGTGLEGETVTPTGAAIVAAVCREFGPMPAMRLQATGYGVGTRQWPDRPNVLRAVLGTREAGEEEVVVLETNVDDLTPELAGNLMDRLMEEGALDVAFLPAHMKKNRPGFLVHVLSSVQDRDRLTTVLFRESTTIGVRWYRAARTILPRTSEILDTRLGPVHVKLVETPDGVRRAYPEYGSCLELARRLGVPVIEVMAEVLAVAKSKGMY